jgi:antitoxin (DNA-binding transcriptional repressor) of toxin-antitoxin stability system
MLKLCTQRSTILTEAEMLQKIGMREFRNNLSKYLNATSPVAILRHGQTIGYFFPTQPQPEEAELEGLKRAAAKLDALLQAQGIGEDILVAEFRQLREQQR